MERIVGLEWKGSAIYGDRVTSNGFLSTASQTAAAFHFEVVAKISYAHVACRHSRDE